jgi:hypothetical protein
MAVEVEGLDALNRRLASLPAELQAAGARGAFAAGLMVQGKSQENTPVEYGVLRASAYTQRTANGAEVGHSAEYAIYVHENMEQKLKGEPRPSGLGTYWNPGGPKFLERAVNENLSEISDLVEGYIEQALRR